jgi:hypothetical protein
MGGIHSAHLAAGADFFTVEVLVCAEQPRATRPLPPQDGHLMSQSEQLKAPAKRGYESGRRAAKRGRKDT